MPAKTFIATRSEQLSAIYFRICETARITPLILFVAAPGMNFRNLLPIFQKLIGQISLVIVFCICYYNTRYYFVNYEKEFEPASLTFKPGSERLVLYNFP